VILIASAVRLRHLNDGGGAIAARMGGREIDFSPSKPDEQRLRNVVEEMAIASTVPVPRIFVLDDEASINAFAAGSDTDDCAIAVSAGALQHLDRDELQGVVAHEFSHILNGDMRLNVRLMALLFGLFAVTVAGRVLFHIGRASRSSRASLPIFLAGAALLLVGSIGLLAGRVIQAAISRSRERLADASAVQFTRQQRGLADALKKIAAHPRGARLQNPHAGEVAHMLFGDGISRTHWLSTHPPLLERIQALEPGFGPARLQAFVQRWQAQAGTTPASSAAPHTDRGSVESATVMPLAATASTRPSAPSSRLSLEWQTALRDADSALSVVTALLDDARGDEWVGLRELPINQQVNLALPISLCSRCRVCAPQTRHNGSYCKTNCSERPSTHCDGFASDCWSLNTCMRRRLESMSAPAICKHAPEKSPTCLPPWLCWDTRTSSGRGWPTCVRCTPSFRNRPCRCARTCRISIPCSPRCGSWIALISPANIS